MAITLHFKAYRVETACGRSAELEAQFEYEPAWPGTHDVQGTGSSIDLRRVVYNGRNVMRLLSKQTVEEIETDLRENYCDEPFDEFSYD